MRFRIAVASFLSATFLVYANACDTEGTCTAQFIPAVRITVACDALPALGEFHIFGKLTTEDDFNRCDRQTYSCTSGSVVVAECGPYIAGSGRDATYDIRLAQADFVRDIQVFVNSDECHPDTEEINMP